MENDLPSYQKPKYIPKPYNVNEICKLNFDKSCKNITIKLSKQIRN